MRLTALFTLLTVMLLAADARAQTLGSPSAPQQVEEARRDARYSFCQKPRLPLSARQRELCPLAWETEGCAGFAAACQSARDPADEKAAPRTDPASSRSHHGAADTAAGAAGAVAQVLVWLLVALVIAAMAFPLVRALMRARRDKAVADAPKKPNVAVPTEKPEAPRAETISDAEAALRQADDHARRGDYGPALSLYLAASLAALDRRGAIRLARHRTNGEYVRSCGEETARQPLREIVREVDRFEFGKLAPTSARVAEIAARASSVVRAPASPRGAIASSLTSMMLLVALALAVAGCGGGGATRAAAVVDDPAGEELPLDVLRRSGYEASYLTTSLAALPVPRARETAPVVVVDVTRVPLEEESSAHLMRWVESGGVLVLFGPPLFWPTELHAKAETAEDDHVDVIASEVYARGARVGVKRALHWPEAEAIAFAGKSVYAAHIKRGQGAIVGVAGHELFTNMGVARPDNAGVFVALFDVAMADRHHADIQRGVTGVAPNELRIARRDDGIPSPSNPFSALVQAGLGKGSWHALAASLILFLAFGIRQARPRPAVPAVRRAFAEHVEATGAFYGRARAMGHALASYGRFAEMRLRERVPRGTDPVHFLALRAKVAPEEAARLWKRATEASADDPPRGDELATIRDLGVLLAKALETG